METDSFPLRLTVVAEATPDELAALTQDLYQTLRTETDVSVAFAPLPPEPGTKGESFAYDTLILVLAAVQTFASVYPLMASVTS